MNVVIWGLRADYESFCRGAVAHSHAWIHAGYFRGFRALDHQTVWVNDSPQDACAVRPGSLVFCVNLAVAHLPIVRDCIYVGHHTDSCAGLHEAIRAAGAKVLLLGVWLARERRAGNINPWTHFDSQTLFQPWATRLFPHEFFDPVAQQSQVVHWCGSVWNDHNNCGNEADVRFLAEALRRHGVELRVARGTDEELNRLTRESRIAPAIQGGWQVGVGYIPCLAFINASCGQAVLTDTAVVEIMEGHALYRPTITELVDAALSLGDDQRRSMADQAARLVARHHTYLNRAAAILRLVREL